MYDNFENLQKKCKRYYFKQRIKFATPFLVAIPLIIGSYLFLEKSKPKVIQTSQTQVIKAKEIVKVNIKKIKEKVKETTIEDIPYALQIDRKYLQKKEIIYKKKVTPKEKPKVYIKREEPKALAITVKKISSVSEMKKYYKKEKKYSLALKIAQTYYDEKDYSQSLLWAKKANLLNRDADGAWILYAKSEYAVGNKERAIKILNLYITNADSNEAKALLITWRQGK